MKEAVIATITDVGFGEPHKIVRAACTLKMFELAQEHGYPVVAVDAGSPVEYVDQMKQRGVMVREQEQEGMGAAQRQALSYAAELVSAEGAVVYTESEKYPLIPNLQNAIETRNREEYDLVMLQRKSLESYPPEQAKSYELIALAMEYLTGIKSDFGWGPTVLSRQAVEYYTTYVSDYGDSWDAIHCPKLRIIKDGLSWTVMPVSYEHPPEQTAAETGMRLFMKRIQQAEQLVGAMTAEVGRLGMRSASP